MPLPLLSHAGHPRAFAALLRLPLLALLWACCLAVQARQAGEPRSWSLPATKAAAIPLLELEPVDAAALLAEDAAGAGAAKGGGALRFAIPRSLHLTPARGGRWLALADGGRLWQARLRVPGATDLNFTLSRFALPRGATLHLFSAGERYYEGPYTAADMRAHGRFWSPVVPGEEAVLELYLPAGAGEPDIALAAVNAGYRDLFGRNGGPVLKAGACNVDVACPLGDAYRDEIRSVARYTINGGGLCTGTLVMDAAASFTPWFLTAAHCGISNESVADSLVFYWNFERASCGSGSGSLADNQAGAAFRARRVDVDMGLVELDATPDPASDVHYAGWDRSGAAPLGSTHIHHPNGDEKAISLNDDPLTTTDSCIVNGTSDTHWYIDTYEQGTTEPGSSGSGVWTPAPSPRLIGFLSGGDASCANPGGYDCYGKFDVAWDGASAGTRLRDWLGGGLPAPPLQVDGSDPVGFTIALEPPALAACRGDTVAADVVLTATGGFADAVTLSTTGLPPGVAAAFASNPLTPPDATAVLLTIGGAAAIGDHLLQVEGTAGPASSSNVLSLRVDASAPAAPALLAPMDGSSAVDLFPTFSWSEVAGASGYRLEVAADGDFADPLLDVVVQGTEYSPALALQPLTSYQWRVSAQNGCGDGGAGAAIAFTTGSAWCRSEAAAIPDGNAGGVLRSMQIAGAGDVLDLDLHVDIDHTYVGDLSLLLRHEPSGIEVLVLDRPGVPGSAFGCGGNDIEATLDDEAGSAAETRCSGTPALSGPLRPNELLSALDGQPLEGTWTLLVSDAAEDDTGTLQRWCLQPQLALPMLLFRDGFE